MTVRRYGYIKDRADVRDRLMALRPSGAPLPNESDLWLRVPRWRDQGNTGSCVGHGVVGALELQRIIDGSTDVALSPAHCYCNARLIGLLPGEHLMDTGAMIRDGMKGAANLGVCEEALWPLSEATIDQRPSAADDEKGVIVADHPYERIAGFGEALLQNVLHALTTGPVVIGFDVPQSFEDYQGGVWAGPQPGEQSLGGHCTTLTGYRNGGAQLRLQNSWSEWGEAYTNAAGVTIESAMWVDASFITGPYFVDAWTFGAKL